MKIPWKTTVIGLATGGLLAAALAGTLILHRASASPSGAAPPPSRAVSTEVDFGPVHDIWQDDAGGTVPQPTIDTVRSRCQADDLSLSVRPDRSHYGSGEVVTFIFDARFKGTRRCVARGGGCAPDVTVLDASGRVVWREFGEEAGAGCSGAPVALLSTPSQHLRLLYYWRQDDCGLFCHEDTRQRAAPAGQYTATAPWLPFGSTPPSQPFTLE